MGTTSRVSGPATWPDVGGSEARVTAQLALHFCLAPVFESNAR